MWNKRRDEDVAQRPTAVPAPPPAAASVTVMKGIIRSFCCMAYAMYFVFSASASPIGKHPDNPHYFTYKGNPMILLSTDEHYGAVINLDFDYISFLNTLQNYGMNLTRVYPGGYVEYKDQYVKGNPLGPAPGRYILPWKKSAVPGASPHIGVYKYDLDKWDIDYFKRLKDFVYQASLRDIIVEIALFNGMYDDRWSAQPLFHANNIQGIGTHDFKQFTTIADKKLMDVQIKYVKKIGAELYQYDNVIYDISDEPEMQRQDSRAWNSALLDALIEVDHYRHLYGETANSVSPDFTGDRRTSWIPTEYVSPMEMTLDNDYADNKPIVNVETAYYASWYGSNPVEETRAEGWYGMLGGLAGLIHLNGDFSIQNPAAKGTTTQSSILPQKKVLMAFMHSLDFIRMKKFTGFTVSGSEIQARGIAEPGKQYALYLFHGNRKWEDWPQNRCAVRFNVIVGRFKDTVKINIPPGKYKIDWVNPSSGVLIDSTTYQGWRGGDLILQTPVYHTDLALRMKSLKPIQ